MYRLEIYRGDVFVARMRAGSKTDPDPIPGAIQTAKEKLAQFTATRAVIADDDTGAVIWDSAFEEGSEVHLRRFQNEP